jgi:hypothetical protein
MSTVKSFRPTKSRIKTVRNTSKERKKSIIRNQILSQYRITDEHINEFKSFVKAPNDCVINALQIMGMIDGFTGNMLRISVIGQQTGFTKKQIELIFTLRTGKPFRYHPMNYETFSKTIKEKLMPGHIVFAGYTGHAFLIGRTLDGNLFYIDPQSEVGICNLADINCEELIKHQEEYFLLYHTETQLSIKELRKLGFHINE